jgi:hypothetical protein
MNAIFSILTTASILTHSVFGCCWHHSHSCEVGHAEVVAATVGDDVHACCSHHHHSSTSNVSDEDASEDVPGDNHSGHEACDDSGCWLFSVVRTDFTFQLAVATATIDQDYTAELSRTLFATGESLVAPWQKPNEPLRAMIQTWLL